MAANIVAVTSERETLGAAARQHVLEAGYGWDATFRRLFGLYQRAMDQAISQQKAGSAHPSGLAQH
jgi:alpha-1,6-mannosyltransferase